MNCYFEEGEVFTWIRDRERSGENMVVSLKMLKECHRTGSKQAMIAEDIRTGKKYFVKVLFCIAFDKFINKFPCVFTQ